MMSLKSKFIDSHLRIISIFLIIPLILTLLLFSKVQSQGLTSSTLISAPVPSSKSAKNTDQILIELPEGYLCEVLDQFERKSGIRFNCPDKLEDHFSYARTLEGPSWESVANLFLEDYNILTMFNDAGEITQFYLLGSKGRAISNPGVFTSQSKRNQPVVPEKTAIPGLPGSNLNRSQLFALLKTSTFKPFPQHFFNISDYQEILSFAGIKKPEDWMVVEKSRALKEHIQKLLKN